MEELQNRAERTGSVTVTHFLTPAECLSLKERLRAGNDVTPFFTGGSAECERQVCFFLPFWCPPEEAPVEDNIRCVRLKAYFGEPSHRDYLGAALAPGIRREWLGDIRILGDTAYIFCLPSVESTLLSLEKVGRVSVKAASVPLAEVPVPEKRVKEVRFTVKSLRLDAVTGELFSVSRTEAADAIRLGLVQLNYVPCTRTDAGVKEGDILSFRGKGKGTLAEIGGQSRKDRTFVRGEVWL